MGASAKNNDAVNRDIKPHLESEAHKRRSNVVTIQFLEGHAPLPVGLRDERVADRGFSKGFIGLRLKKRKQRNKVAMRIRASV